MKYYSGIGSRETPLSIKETIKEIVEILNKKDYILRSGGAPGADSFFEEFADKKEIYLPWPKFNANSSELNSVCKNAYKVAKKFHPAWERLSEAGKKLMARNSYQVLGQDLQTPVDFIICWTPGGKLKGGTAQAMRIANFCHIPVYNLFDTDKILHYFREVHGNYDFD